MDLVDLLASVDTSAVVEYIDRSGGFHQEAVVLMRSVALGNIEALIPHPVLVELHYVTSRICEESGENNPAIKASDLIHWLSGLPTSQSLRIASISQSKLEELRENLVWRLLIPTSSRPRS